MTMGVMTGAAEGIHEDEHEGKRAIMVFMYWCRTYFHR